jgi:sulfoxide reductase heme-binding subunit YedZ
MNTNLAISSSRVTKKTTISKLTATVLKIGIHLIGLFPLIELIYKSVFNQLTANPIQFMEQFLGRAALNVLIVSLAVTPLITITGWKRLVKHRRALGLYAFLYFTLHFSTFAVLDYGLDLREIFSLTTEKPFIFVGSLAGVLLIVLAATSFKYWMKHLGKNWHKLHKSVYLIGGLVVLHYAWAVKGSLSTLSGNIIRPLLMGLLVIILMVLRMPIIKQRVISIRQGFKGII